jgi:hypothetical protein
MSLWRMGLGLAFSVAYGAGMILALITPGLQPMFVLVPALVAIAASIALNIAARGPRWWRSDSEDRRIYKDEWVKEITNRARSRALLAVYLVQAPLIFFVAYSQPEPTAETSVVGMSALTVAAGLTAYFASYLHSCWTHADG